MTNKESIEVKIIDSLGDDDLLQNIEPLLELGIDGLTDSPLIEKLPVVNIGFAVGKTILMTRDYLFARKVLKFLVSIEHIPFDKRQQFLNKLNSRKKKIKIGLTVLELIDKANSENKAYIVGLAYKHHILGNFKYSDFVRIAEMIVDAYSSDLTYFFNRDEQAISETGDEVEHLIALGFYDRVAHKFGDTIMYSVQPKLSSYGKLIKDLQ